MRRISFAVGLLVTVFCTMSARAQQPRSRVVAVFEIESRGSGLKPQEIIALTDYLGTRLGEDGRFLIVPPSEIKKRLLEQKKESYKSCYDQSCQVEIGRELSAQLTVSASISRVGSRCILTAGMYDLKKAATIRTATTDPTACNADQLVEAVKTLADKLLGGTELAVKPPVEPGPEELPPPKEQPRPRPRPRRDPAPVTVSSSAQELSLPKTSSQLNLLITVPKFIGGTLQNSSGFNVGMDATLDFTAGGWFVFGPGVRAIFTKYLGIEVNFHIGAAIDLGGGFILFPSIAFGFTPVTAVQFENDPENAIWDALGFNARGGLGFRWMWSNRMGMSMDVTAGYATWSVYEDEGGGQDENDGQAVEIGITAGILWGW